MALVPVAAGALYPLAGVMLSPVIAALAMSASSLFVLGNSLRLRGAGTARAASGAMVASRRAAAAE